MHTRAAIITDMTSSANFPVGSSSLLSSKSSKNNSVLSDKDEEFNSSPGCLPNITSNATTPKLYTSHLSVTCIVCASSAFDREIPESINMKNSTAINYTIAEELFLGVEFNICVHKLFPWECIK